MSKVYGILVRNKDIRCQIVGGSAVVIDKKDLKISKGLIRGYENGNYEPAANYDRSEFRNHSLGDPKRRDNRISIRVSGRDLELLHKLALEEGIPSQFLIASIVHKYVNGLLLDMPDSSNRRLIADLQQPLDNKTSNK
jgi:predicted DNA binding CopG/RHH family protein